MSDSVKVNRMFAALCFVSFSVVGGALLYAQGFPSQSDAAVEQKIEDGKDVIRSSDSAGHCSAACTQCANTCLSMIQYCEKIGEKYDALKAACQDCLAVCRLTADTEERGSPLHEMMMPVCIEACRLTIEQCKAYPEDDYCKACIRDCNACMGACELHLKGGESQAGQKGEASRSQQGNKEASKSEAVAEQQDSQE